MEKSCNVNKKKIKILILHGFLQDGNLIKLASEDFIKGLSNIFDVEIITLDGPLQLSKTKSHLRGWVKWDLNNMSEEENFKLNEKEYLEFENVPSFITNYIVKENHFDIDIIIGFSQGALITLFLSVLMHSSKELKDKYFSKLSLIMLFSGFCRPIPSNKELNETFKSLLSDETAVKNKLNINSIHIYGQKDVYIKPEQSKEVNKMFNSVDMICENFIHNEEHKFPKLVDFEKNDFGEICNIISKIFN